VATAVFWIASIVALVGGLGVVLSRQAIRSVLSLVLVMLSLSVLFLLLSAQFIFAVQVIVYAGAVMVLFLFVIALLGPVREGKSQRLRFQSWFGLGFALILGIVIYSALSGMRFRAPDRGVDQSAFGTVQHIAAGLFTTYLYPFELTSLLLLVAAVGAIYLSRREPR
jgi:NADH-quinone oxidoreductase subunit J